MAANGRGNMRPQSRSPPFLITGLVVALVILGANYWNLSSSNASLSAEVADLQDQIRVVSSNKINIQRKNDNAMLRVRDIEMELNKKKLELKTSIKELGEIGSAKESCTSKLKQSEDNINGIQQELATYKEKVQKFESSKPTEKQQNCDAVCTEKRRELFSLMEKLGYYQVLQGLSQNGVDIFEFKDKISGRQGNQKSEGETPKDGSLQGSSQDKSPLIKGSRPTTSQPGQNKTTTKKPGKPATGSILDVKIRGGSKEYVESAEKGKVTKSPESGSKSNATRSSLGSVGSKGGNQNATASKGVTKPPGGQPDPNTGLIMFRTNNSQNFNIKNAVVGEGIKQVLPSAKVRLMNVGNNVVEMKNNEKPVDEVKKLEKTKQAEKLRQNNNDIEGEEEYIDDNANDKKPKQQNLLEKTNKHGAGQRNQDPAADYEDEDDDPAKDAEVKH
ncbi:protein GOLM2-like isoform X2 [Ostrea edulis]|uniref:protein GOLM2-like isoform X2 n=1 Tax=Ostrea edulis TaxID=37623 RepID=UPI0020950142|nr:protein GOLM2-like isoform X2 [Ostrea edulis]